jgi:hypothetical protein
MKAKDGNGNDQSQEHGTASDALEGSGHNYLF